MCINVWVGGWVGSAQPAPIHAPRDVYIRVRGGPTQPCGNHTPPPRGAYLSTSRGEGERESPYPKHVPQWPPPSSSCPCRACQSPARSAASAPHAPRGSPLWGGGWMPCVGWDGMGWVGSQGCCFDWWRNEQAPLLMGWWMRRVRPKLVCLLPCVQLMKVHPQ